MMRVFLFVLILCGMLATGCEQSSKNFADTIITNAAIYTVDEDNPWAEAAAIKSGKYIYVGDASGVQAHRGPLTKIHNLDGKMAMPGINDAHVHPFMGGSKNLFECNFSAMATPDQIAETISKCVKENPDNTWIIGGQWNTSFFDHYNISSPREFLDAVSGDKAVLLSDDSTHNGWANSKALALAGITDDTPDPKDGTFARNPMTGKHNGILLEGADKIVKNFVPKFTDEQVELAALNAIGLAHQFGITGMKDAGSFEHAIAAYQRLDKQDKLGINMAVAIRTPYGHRTAPLDYDRIDRIRDRYQSANVHTSFVKIFMDGIPTASHTAAMLEPYRLLSADDEPTAGSLHIQPDLLARDLIELDKRGYTVKIHAAGDRAVRVSLDAIEAARNANGQSGLRHEVAHAGYIHADDLPRFKNLGAVAELSPYLWFPSPINDAISDALGKTSKPNRYWPILDLTKSGAFLAAGSDWPSVSPTMNPWIGIEAMVTRRDPYGQRKDSLWHEQAISLEQAINIFTINGAKALGQETRTGSIEVGKSADLIVLDQNLFDANSEKISDTKIIKTFFGGDLVFKSE